MSDYKNLQAEAKALNESLPEEHKIKLFGASNEELVKAVKIGRQLLATDTDTKTTDDVESEVLKANKKAENPKTDLEQMQEKMEAMEKKMETLQTKPKGNDSVTIQKMNGKPMSMKAQAVKDILDKEPKMGYNLRLDTGDKAGDVRTVTINGYRLNLRKGMYHPALPKSVVELLERRDNTSLDQGFGKDLRIDSKADVQNALS